MVYPHPNKGEQVKDFIQRCMNDKSMQKEYYQNEHRYTVCNNCWERANLKENSTAFELDATETPHKARIFQTQANEALYPVQEAILANVIQLQQQYRVYASQNKTAEEQQAFASIAEKLDENAESFIEEFINKYGNKIYGSSIDLELWDYKNKQNCITVTDGYITFLSFLSEALAETDKNLIKAKDLIKENLILLKTLLSK